MALLNQSTTVQKIIDQCSLHTSLQNYFNVGGIMNEPGLTICNKAQQMLLSTDMAWKFNRKELSSTAGNFMVTQFGVQDIRFAGATAFVLITNNLSPNVQPSGGVGIDLALSPINGGTAAIQTVSGTTTVQTLDPHPFAVGQIIFMSGNTASVFNSVFSFNQLTQTSKWTNGFVITSVPDNQHFTFAVPAAATATITAIAITSNVLTVTATNTYQVGQQVLLNGLTTNTFLNGQYVTLVTASSTNFTAAFTNSNVSSSDTGTATLTSGAPGIIDFHWMESASITDINSTAFPLPIRPIDAVHRLAPNYTTTGDRLAVCALIDYQNGVMKFRLSEPSGTYCVQINVVYQARAPKLTSPQSVFAWPDDMSIYLEEVCLWLAMRFAKGISAQEVQAQGQMAGAMVLKALQAEDIEDNVDAITPQWSLAR